MSSKTILITGASGSIGRKLRAHFASTRWQLRLLCRNPGEDPEVTTADLANDSETWAKNFEGVDIVIHLAAEANAAKPWSIIYHDNVKTMDNVLRAATTYKVRRVIFASSNWVMAGYKFRTERLTTDIPPMPINGYGVSKLYGEGLGKLWAGEDDARSFIALRIGSCPHDPINRPGPHLGERWVQLMWLSDRDLCHGMERAALCQDAGFSILNLMSDNPGMRWDLSETRKIIGYQPQDGASAVITPRLRLLEYVDYLRHRLGAYHL